MQKTSLTWIQNKGYAYHLDTDDEVLAFLYNEGLGQIVDKIIKSNAPRVMIADIWRYAVVYSHGGYYADLDTVCQKPIPDWIPRQDYDCDMIIALENDIHFCQWTFASSAGHPALARVLELIAERAETFPKDIPDFVHWHTGPAVFTAGILDILGLDATSNAVDAYRKLQWNPEIQKRAAQLGLCVFSDDLFKRSAVTHQYSSQWTQDEAGYQSWTKAATQFRQSSNSKAIT